MEEKLNAWKIQRYGGPEVLAPVTLDIPEPTAKEILIRIHASAVTRADGMIRAGTPKFARLFLGLGRPRNDLVGTGLSGEVIATGSEVSRFSVGDMVFGEAGLQFGANATHICLDEDGVLMPKPSGLSHESAAVLCDGALTSFNFLHQIARLKRDERVLILGGSGSLGSAAVQIAAQIGADVTATTSARNADLVASLGAAQVINYESDDFRADKAGFDVIFDTLGVSSFAEAKPVLKKNGKYICPVLGCELLVASIRTSLFGTRKAHFSATGMLKPEKLREMLAQLLAMVNAHEIAPVIDRTYSLDQLPQAHAVVETGRKRGNFVVV